MKKIKIILATLLLLVVCSTTAFAREDIRVVFEEPVVYEVKAGDSLPYRLNIILPDNYTQMYRSFAITVLMDKNIEVSNVNISGADDVKNQIVIDKTSIKDSGQDICTVNVNDVKTLNGVKEFSVAIDAKARITTAGDSFKNSFVVTTTNIDGKEDGSQTSVTTNDEVKQSELTINDITEKTTTISGKATPNSKIVAYINDEVYKEVNSDENGNFSFETTPLAKGTTITFKNFVKNLEVPIVKSVTIKSQVESDLSVQSFMKLRDYTDRAKSLETRNASQEDAKRLFAAVAYGQYMEVKTNLTPSELQDSIDRLEEAMKYIRFPFMKGYSATSFGPNNKLTRSEAAALFAQLSKDKMSEVAFSSFKDVDQKAWYAESVALMEQMEVLKGYSDGTFKPTKPISRAEFAQIISSYADLKISARPLEFSDVKDSYWAKNAIDLVTAAGYMSGKGDGQFHPTDAITRAEVATVMNSFLSRKPDKFFMDKYSKNPYSDLRMNHWAYYQILEATGN